MTRDYSKQMKFNLEINFSISNPCLAKHKILAKTLNIHILDCKNCGQFHTVNSFVARPDLDQVLAPPQARITCQYCAQSMLDNEYDVRE